MFFRRPYQIKPVSDGVTITAGNMKMFKVPNLSLPPIKTCGNCSFCASGCYAAKAYRLYPSARDAWDKNLYLAENDRPRFFAEINNYIAKNRPKYFRWQQAGDLLDLDYMRRTIDTAVRAPRTRFLVYTKMAEFIIGLKWPENLSVIYSIFPGQPIPAEITAENIRIGFMQDGRETRIPENAFRCSGICNPCFYCWHINDPENMADVYFPKT